MKIWKQMLAKGIMAALLALCFAGCQRVREPETFLLPQEEEPEGSDVLKEEEDLYTVQHIYTKSYETLGYRGATAFLSGIREHQVRLLTAGEYGLARLSVDYRYGFYEEEAFPGTEDMGNYMLGWQAGNGEAIGLEKNFLSPDGRYLLYMEWENSYVGGMLWMRDLDTDEEFCLLNGDELDCPGDQFMVLTAWDRDSTLLCYGFYPKNMDVWKNNSAGKCIFYYMDLESKRVINRLNYSYAAQEDLSVVLEDSSLVIAREGKTLLTALILRYPRQYGLDQRNFYLFTQNIPDSGEMETEGVVMPSIVSCPDGLPFYLDAGENQIYLFYPEEGMFILDSLEGFYLDQVALEPGRNVTSFLALDGGDALITAEYEAYPEQQDICLYLRNGETWTRRILYKNAGNILRLQYDSQYRRLLAEVSGSVSSEMISPKEAEGYGFNTEGGAANVRSAVILEF